jgi:hypothetical protein
MQPSHKACDVDWDSAFNPKACFHRKGKPLLRDGYGKDTTLSNENLLVCGSLIRMRRNSHCIQLTLLRLYPGSFPWRVIDGRRRLMLLLLLLVLPFPLLLLELPVGHLSEKTCAEWRSKWGFFGWANARRGAQWVRRKKPPFHRGRPRHSQIVGVPTFCETAPAALR